MTQAQGHSLCPGGTFRPTIPTPWLYTSSTNRPSAPLSFNSAPLIQFTTTGETGARTLLSSRPRRRFTVLLAVSTLLACRQRRLNPLHMSRGKSVPAVFSGEKPGVKERNGYKGGPSLDEVEKDVQNGIRMRRGPSNTHAGASMRPRLSEHLWRACRMRGRRF